METTSLHVITLYQTLFYFVCRLIYYATITITVLFRNEKSGVGSRGYYSVEVAHCVGIGNEIDLERMLTVKNHLNSLRDKVFLK